MKKLSLLLLFVAAFFVVTLPGCRKPEEDDDNGGGGGGGTPVAEQFGVIKVTAKTGPLTPKANATVSLAGTQDSLEKRLFKSENIQVTNGSGIATFSGLKLKKTYYFYSEYTEAGQFFTGDTTGVVNVPNSPASVVLMLKPQ